jgi:hypothetical protein
MATYNVKHKYWDICRTHGTSVSKISDVTVFQLRYYGAGFARGRLNALKRLVNIWWKCLTLRNTVLAGLERFVDTFSRAITMVGFNS